MATDELEFANDPHGAVHRGSRSSTWAILIVIGAAFAAAVAWAAQAHVQQVTSGEGRVIPSSQVQVVESLEPGIVSEILVADGDRVEQDQVLVRIDDTGSGSRLGELERREADLKAEQRRLEAHLAGATTYSAPDNLAEENRAFFLDQKAVFDANRRRLDDQASIRRSQLDQKLKELDEADATAENARSLLAIADKELNLISRLFRRKAVPEIDYIRVQRESSRLTGQLKIAEATRERLEAEIAEARLLVETNESEFLGEVTARLSRVNADLAIVQQTLRAASDTVRRAALRSPVNGIINKLHVAAINEVVNAGSPVVEIVPLDDTLLVEVKVRPEDIAFIRPGLDATIRITAYDYTRFGTLTGKVERIGADTVTDRDNNTFYQVIVSTGDGTPSGKAEELQIIPGMVASVDIATGERSVLEYLVKPLLVLKDEALRDPR